MTTARTSSRNLHTLFHVGALSGLTDGQLLERFATRRDHEAELAFAALVERHGPMVYRVCRDILRDDHEAMDAFQATFLILVRKGRTLWVHNSLGPWLHRVARSTSSRARAQEVRRRALIRGISERRSGQAVDTSRDQAAAILHEELDRLPDRYRVPIVLCDLEGWSCEEVARHLGKPVGTVKSWRARGRERLKGRLTRRGLTGFSSVSIPGLTILHPGLLRSTIDALVRIAKPNGTVGVLPATVTTLVEGALRSMIISKLKTIGLALLSVGLVAGSAGVFAYQSPAPESDRRLPEARTPTREERDPAPTFQKAYYIGDLLLPPREGLPGPELQKARAGSVDMKPLIELLKTHVATGTWTIKSEEGKVLHTPEVPDGAVGSMTPFYLSLSLIIRHKAEVHEQIADRLRMLRDYHFLIQPGEAPDPRAKLPHDYKLMRPVKEVAEPPIASPDRSERIRHLMKELNHEVETLAREKTRP